MVFELDALALLKLALGLAAFVFIGWVGARDKRIVGVLLTFPILNGIAMLVDPQPFRVASAIYPIAMFNSALFWVVVTFAGWVPFAARTGGIVSLALRLAVWMALWFAGAWVVTEYRDALPAGPALFAVQACAAALYLWLLWRPPLAVTPAGPRPSRAAFYLGWGLRLAFFVAVFLILLATAQNATDPKWVGMASALPLPGLFAVAYLAHRNDGEGLKPIRDTVLLGPLLVIPFNFVFAAWVTWLPSGLRTLIGTLSLLIWWGAGLALVFWLIPWLERRLDGPSTARP